MASSGDLSRNNSADRTDLVAYWSIALYDGIHTIEFEHGTTTGKRVLRIDGKVRILLLSLTRNHPAKNKN